ncbi:MAG: dihydroorotase [Flavobacteriales bacterium]|jgi:dihydroorotase|nr:dihydroorotase [Flavobacteriales bacterium]
MNFLIKQAKIIDKESKNHLKKMDIFIENGIIKSIGKSLSPTKTHKIIDLENLHVSTGWFDSSVCFGEPGYEERETLSNGLNVAAKSGFTAVAINPLTNPITDNKAGISFIKEKANNNLVNVYPIGALTQKSEGVELAEMYDMQQAGAIAFTDYGKGIANSNLLKLALQYTQNFDAIVMSFPLDINIASEGQMHEAKQSTLNGLKGIPAMAEIIQIKRDLTLLTYTGGRLHIPTISCKRSVQLIKNAKKKGLKVTCSVAAHHLVLTDTEISDFDTSYKVSPPLREPSDIKALINGVLDGTIDMITSDHNPIDIENKKIEFAHALNGSIGLESLFGAVNNCIDLEILIEALTNKPRKCFNLETTSVNENQLANLTFFNPKGDYIFEGKHILSTSKNAIFLNKNLKGKVYGVINNGKMILN